MKKMIEERQDLNDGKINYSEIKDVIEYLSTFPDDSVLEIDYYDCYGDIFITAEVVSTREETDAELYSRLSREKRADKLLKKNRHDLYLSLKGEFEINEYK